MARQDPPDIATAALTSWAYERLMQRAHAVAEESVQRLDDLRARYPSAFPAELVEAVRRFHTHPPGADRSRDERERRRAPRFPSRGSKLILADPQAPKQVWEAEGLERSWGGLAFLSDRPLAVGSVVVACEAGAPSSPPVRVEVKSCRPEGGAWAVGCAFLPGPEPGGGA
jgi:hypothetical protein